MWNEGTGGHEVSCATQGHCNLKSIPKGRLLWRTGLAQRCTPCCLGYQQDRGQGRDTRQEWLPATAWARRRHHAAERSHQVGIGWRPSRSPLARFVSNVCHNTDHIHARTPEQGYLSRLRTELKGSEYPLVPWRSALTLPAFFACIPMLPTVTKHCFTVMDEREREGEGEGF